MRRNSGVSDLAVVSIAAGVLLAVGATVFFVATPKGRSMLSTAEPVAAEPALAPEAVMFFEKARNSLAKESFDEAEVAARASLSLEPGYEDARRLLSEVIERKALADKIRRETAHDSAIDMAERLIEADDFEAAEAQLRKALEASPDSASARRLMSEVQRARDRKAELRRQREERVTALVRQGMARLLEGDWKRSGELADEALSIDPGSSAAAFLKRQSETEARRVETASGTVGDDTRRQEAERFFEIAEVSYAAGDAAGAEAFARKALEVWPAHAKARALLEKTISERFAGARPAGQDPRVREIVAFLEELDDAIRGRNTARLEAFLSRKATGGLIFGVAEDRSGEIANANEFFRVARDIAIERRTEPSQIRVTEDYADAISEFRISFEVAGTRVSRAYKCRYNLVREAGVWRIRNVTVEEERP